MEYDYTEYKIVAGYKEDFEKELNAYAKKGFICTNDLFVIHLAGGAWYSQLVQMVVMKKAE